jgi:hypothetical protein
MKGGLKMDKSVQITLIIVGAFLLMGIIGVTALYPNTTSNTVTGNGAAEIKAMPDIIGVYFSIETNASTSAAATDANSVIVDKLTTELIKQGFETKDIQTISFNVYQDYKWDDGESTPNGYKATHSLRVEMSADNSDNIGDAIDAGVNAGAGISYINFELSQAKQNEYKAQALKLASQDAKIKAQAVAEGLGKRIGRLVNVASNDFNYYPWNIYGAAGSVASAEDAKLATTRIQPSEQSISASVTATFKIF